MRRISSSWKATFDKLGFRRRRSKKPQFRRSRTVEMLESRHMMTTSPIMVDTLVDENDGIGNVSLREALAIAADNISHPGADTIKFAPELFNNGPATITLEYDGNNNQFADDIFISSSDAGIENVTIEGPGAELLSIDGDEQNRVFSINWNADLTLRGLTVTGGGNVEGGAGIYNNGTLRLESVRVTDNHTTGLATGSDFGGGIASSGSIYVIDSSIDNNTARWGAGMSITAWTEQTKVEISGSAIYQNHALDENSAGLAGGLDVKSAYTAADLSIVNTTFSDNTAGDSAGVRVDWAGHVFIINSTITLNRATAGVNGGLMVVNQASAVTMHNSIVAGNLDSVGGGDHRDIVTWGGVYTTDSSHNLVGVGGNSGLVHDDPRKNIVGTSGSPANPLLLPLGNYGGRTKSHALLPNSQAIDAGDNDQALDSAGAPLTSDQRGGKYKRQLGTAVDIGAVEANVVQATSSSPIAVYGTDGADGIYVGKNAVGADVVSLDTVAGHEFSVNLTTTPSITVDAWAGDDAVSIDPVVTKPVTIQGGEGDDLLVGGSGTDVIRGGMGADTLHGGDGVDTLYGYLNGSTYLHGDGADSLFGDAGTDQYYASRNSDIYKPDTGEDFGQDAPAPLSASWNHIIQSENSGFGSGWHLANADRLVFGADPENADMIRWVRPDGFLVDIYPSNDDPSDPDYSNPSNIDESCSTINDDDDPDYYVRTDKFGNKSYYSKNSADEGLLKKTADRLGNTRTYEYEENDEISTTFEIRRVTLRLAGQLVEETTEYDYDGTDRIQWVTDPFGRVTNLDYDLEGRLQRIKLPAPDPAQPRPTFTFGYDEDTNFISSITDADQRLTSYEFDAETQELKVTNPDNTTHRKLLPAIENVFDDWRSQLGSWREVLPQFKYKVDLTGIDTGETKAGYVIDELGRTSTFEINSEGHITEMTDAAGQTTVYDRNAAGLPTLVTVKAAGDAHVVSETAYQYDDNYNLERIDYFDGTFETWTYDAYSRVLTYTDQLSHQTTYDYHTNDQWAAGAAKKVTMRRVVGLNDLASNEHNDVVTIHEYEADGLVKRVIELRNNVDGTEQDSRVIAYTYTTVSNGPGDHIGRWLASTTYGGDDPNTTGTVSVEDRNAYGMPIKVHDELDRETQFVYDDLDRLTKVTSPPPGYSQLQPIIEYAYTLSGLLKEQTQTHATAVTTERITTGYEFDDNGRVQQVIEDYYGQDPAVTTYVYDDAGNVIQTIDPRLEDTYFTYDVLDRPIRITEDDPDGTGALKAPVTLLAYDALGRLVASRDAVNQVTRREYDALGRLTKVARPLGATTTMAYDAAGQLLRETDPLGRIAAYSYDDAGRLASMWQPGNVVATRYQYDSAGNLRKTIDPLNHTSEQIYDERFRLREEKDANGDSTLYDYTNANELKKLTDAEFNETTWIYDGAGRVRSETNELDHTRYFKYDAYGRLEEKTDRNGRVTKYEYDRLHQLAAEKWYVGTVVDRTITYDFDKVGNLEYVSDPSATYDPEYDALGRQSGVTQTIVGLTPTIRFDRGYDAADRMTSSFAKIGGVSDYANVDVYDALGRMTIAYQLGTGGHAVTNRRVDFTYNAASQPTSTQRYLGTTTSNPVAGTEYAYDQHGRLSSIDHGTATGSTFAESHGYDYDSANRLTQYTNLIDDIVADYGYDNRGQLTAADHVGTVDDESYGYDDNGNRDLQDGQSYVIDPNNRIYSDGTYTYLYDDEGNVIRRTDVATDDYITYAWDYRNRLINVTEYEESEAIRGVSYSYDALNQLVSRAEWYHDGSNEKSIFVHDDGQIVLQFHEGALGSIQVGDLETDDLSHRYLWGPEVDQLLAEEHVEDLFSAVDNETLWALTDQLGSVRDMVDSNGKHRLHREFDAFGDILDETYYNADGTVMQPGWFGFTTLAFAYTGRPMDETTGLQNNLHRWYDPSVGRWLSDDPIGFSAGDANLYRYVGNAPTMRTDPKGLFVGDAAWHLARALAKPIANPKPEKKVFPDIHVDGPFWGTPVEPIGDGIAIAIFGVRDNPRYNDYSTDPDHDWHDGIREGPNAYWRPNTSTLKDKSVSDIVIRSSPIHEITWKEIVRISKPGAVVTISGPRPYVHKVWQEVQNGNHLTGDIHTSKPRPLTITGIPAAYFHILLREQVETVTTE
jgi:RHS repeat-associated protein